MSSVKEILNRPPRPVLYHYTNQQGLLGIVRTKEIWATHTQYLNDSREFSHAIALVREELKELYESSIVGPPRELLEEMLIALNEPIETINVCVCSFSEVGDQLSQWRAYGGGPGAFSVGFRGEFIKAASQREGFWLVPCLYDEGEQRALIRGLLDDVLQELAKRGPYNPRVVPQPRGGNLVTYLNRYAPILKHKSFAEEREWRIISHPLMCLQDRFDYRPGASMLIPYYRIPLATHEAAFEIAEVFVGPTPHKKPARRSLQTFLAKHNLEKTKIRSTDGPYRSW